MKFVNNFMIMVLVSMLLVSNLGLPSFGVAKDLEIIVNDVMWLEVDRAYERIWYYDNIGMQMVAYDEGAAWQWVHGGIQVPVGTTITVKSNLGKSESNTDAIYDVATSLSHNRWMSYGYDFINKKFVEFPAYDGENAPEINPNLKYAFNKSSADQQSITFDTEGYYTLNFTISSSGDEIGSTNWSSVIVSVGKEYSPDSPSGWAVDAVKKVMLNENLSWNMGDTFFGNFKKQITREEFAKLAMGLYTTINGPYVDAEVDYFTDCDDYTVKSARAHGLITGYSDGSFKPGNSMTRAEISALLVRLMDKANMKYAPANENTFSDLKPSHWAYSAILKAQANGIVAGTGKGIFNPAGAATREQALVMIQNIVDKYYSDNQ